MRGELFVQGGRQKKGGLKYKAQDIMALSMGRKLFFCLRSSGLPACADTTNLSGSGGTRVSVPMWGSRLRSAPAGQASRESAPQDHCQGSRTRKFRSASCNWYGRVERCAHATRIITMLFCSSRKFTFCTFKMSFSLWRNP